MPHSTNTLKQYINILQQCASGNIVAPITLMPTHSLSTTIDEQILFLLKDEGLLIFNLSPAMGKKEPVLLTPKGALAMSEWEAHLKRESLSYRIGENVTKLLWLLLGALIVSLKDIIQYINT